MKDIDLKHQIVEFFIEKAAKYKSFPQSFTPTMINSTIGAYIPRIGLVADEAIKELRCRGIDIEYRKDGNKRYFVMHSPKPQL